MQSTSKVLIIDDEQELLNMYQQAFSGAGFSPILAENGEVGIKMAKDQKPNVILLDIIMPKMNGLDVLEALKKDSETKEIPVILLTNLPEECSGEKAKELGAAGYLVKAETEPAEVVEFVKKIVQK